LLIKSAFLIDGQFYDFAIEQTGAVMHVCASTRTSTARCISICMH